MPRASTETPLQYRNTRFARVCRALLRTQIAKRIAFAVGLKGFNRVQAVHLRYLRDWDGGTLTRKEIVKNGRVYTPSLSVEYNARVNAGAALQASIMSGTTFGSLTSPTHPLYIALSPNTLTPAMTDTTLSGELTTNGLARALGAAQNYVQPTSLDGAASYNVYYEFTYTGASAQTVSSTALFDAASAGNMFAEVNLSTSRTMAQNDILQMTWTVNI